MTRNAQPINEEPGNNQLLEQRKIVKSREKSTPNRGNNIKGRHTSKNKIGILESWNSTRGITSLPELLRQLITLGNYSR